MNEPKLRFRADDGNEFPEWQEKRLGEIFDESVERSDGTEELLAVTIANGITKQSDSNKRNMASNDTSNYKVVHKGDLAYNTMRMWQGAEGASDFNGIISPAYTVLICNDSNDVKFFEYMFKRTCMLNQFEKHSQGLTSDTWNLKYKNFSSIKVFVPSISEQRRIVTCLTSIDNMIEQTQSEIDAWEKQKRGVMQLLFSQKVRFKADDGSEFPEWEERRLDECCEVFTDGDWIESKDQSNSGVRLIQTGNIGVTEYFDKPNNMKWISESTFLKLHCKEVFPGDILISRLPAPAGRACIVPDLGVKMITAVDCTIIRTTFDCNKEFLVQYLATPQYFNQVNSALAGGTRQRISRGNLAEIMIPYPCIEEQQKIAACLSRFDDVIDKAKKELEAYRELKKGLLQQMFV